MHGMNYIGRFLHNFKEFYNDINGATLTGAIDVVVVEQPDGTYNCSPFHVRFGKLGVLRSREKIVDIEINGEPQDIHMKLGESGEAFFVEEVQNLENEEIPEHLATSPIPMSHFEELYNVQGRRRNSITLAAIEREPVVLENQVNDYKKRRNTADNDDEKKREHEFLKRQIGLGNIELGEQSAEELSLSMQSTNKFTSDDISREEISETIFRMDSLEIDSKSESANKEEAAKILQEPVTTMSVKNEPASNEASKSGKKKKRKKSLMKKKNSQRKVPNVTDVATTEELSDPTQETSVNDIKPADSVTDRSSLDSNNSEVELKDLQKTETDITPTANNARKVLDPDFHFFSDTELTSGQQDSRPSTPIHVETVQSDTEFEVKKSKEDGKQDQGQSWAWGQFPVNLSPVSSLSENAGLQNSEQEQHNSMLSSMFSFMKQNKYRRLNSSSEGGVYLADLSSGAIDPDVAALYFTSSKQQKNIDADMDCESGNGPSLTQSPNSAEGSKSIDSDFDDHKVILQDISISMCGWDPEPNEETFTKHVVPFSDLCNNPSVLESPNLVVRLHNKYYNWKVAAPVISSLAIYQRPLPQTTIDQLCSLHMPQPRSQEKELKQEVRYSWWSWRRGRTSSREPTPANDIPQGETSKELSLKDRNEIATMDDGTSRKVELEALEEGYHGSHSSESDHGKDNIQDGKVLSSPSSASSEKCRKTLRLSSEQIACLNLRDGMNEVEFSVTTAYQGTTRCTCYLYKWKWDDKIVISDIDGTITKSDVLGHILPIVGRDWAQSGVAQLFNKIKGNGYKLLYLSARAIGQARITREYLKSIRQGDLSMPDGPLLLNPTSLITAFHREVIEKKPEQFKISCLSDIRALFPSDSNPFYAGYGNRINDVWAYRAVGIPIVRIFTINPKGELKHELTQTFQSSYSNMSYIVDQLFPPLLEAANDYSQFVYWREPVLPLEDIPEIE